jgi:hypothetical protein
VDSLDLSENPMGDLADDVSANHQWTGRLRHLGVGNTGITTWSSVSKLVEIFPNLESLRITENPFYESSNPMKARPILLAVFPTLRSLNGTAVTKRQREEAEKYICSLIVRNDPLVHSVVSETRRSQLHEKYSTHDTDTNVGTEQTSASKRVSNMMQLVMHGPTGTTAIRIPRMSRKADFISIIARKIQWPLKLSQLHVFVGPSDSVEDRFLVEPFSQQELADIGTCDGWHVFTALKDDTVS